MLDLPKRELNVEEVKEVRRALELVSGTELFSSEDMLGDCFGVTKGPMTTSSVVIRVVEVIWQTFFGQPWVKVIWLRRSKTWGALTWYIRSGSEICF